MHHAQYQELQSFTAMHMHELIISVIALIVIIIITSLGLFSQGALNHTFPADMAS